jgi:hypothetical protein
MKRQLAHDPITHEPGYAHQLTTSLDLWPEAEAPEPCYAPRYTPEHDTSWAELFGEPDDD